MFAVLAFEIIPEPSWRQRLAESLKRRSRIIINPQRRWGLKALQVHITFTCRQPSQARQQLVRQALAHIAERHVTYVLLPNACEYSNLLHEYGLRQPDIRTLLPSMAAKLLFHIAEQRDVQLNERNAVVIAPRLNNQAIAAARTVCRHVKTFTLSGGIDTELMARQLRHDYGISVLEQSVTDCRADTDIFLLFDAPPQAVPLQPRPGNIVLELGSGWDIKVVESVIHIDDARYHIPQDMLRDKPPGVSKQRALALLVEAGLYTVENLQIKSLLSCEKKIG
ncbi:MAG: hypothetical protein FWE06_09730 [Oscillospiraceae bacterium]|nr:hypothetical protein [Oscillospiraceae bacterium]